MTINKIDMLLSTIALLFTIFIILVGLWAYSNILDNRSRSESIEPINLSNIEESL